MDGAEIRRLRRRAGLTQEALAECVGVQQGTVSRWERGIELPRPRSANALRNLLLVDLARSASVRQMAMIRNNLVTGVAFDSKARLREINDRTLHFYRRRDNYDLRADLGMSLQQQMLDRDGEVVWNVLRNSGLLKGAALLVRIFVSTESISHLTHYEPFFQDGEFEGVVAYIARIVPNGPKLPPPRLRYADALHLDDLTKMEVLYRGKGWKVVKSLLETDISL